MGDIFAILEEETRMLRQELQQLKGFLIARNRKRKVCCIYKISLFLPQEIQLMEKHYF